MKCYQFIIQVENYELHKEKIEKGPHIRLLDLALTCHRLIQCSTREIISSRVTWEVLELMDLSPEALFHCAKKYSKKALKATIEPMRDMIKGFLIDEFLNETPDDLEIAIKHANDECRRLFQEDTEHLPEMYVLTNEFKIHGASTLFYDELLQQFADEKGCNLILLPSSIHEWLILLEPTAGEIEGLRTMVREANQLVVTPNEILSNQVYRFLYEEKRLEIVSDSGEVW